MNARLILRTSISKSGRPWQIFWSKIPEPKPLVLWFLLVGSVYLVPLSQRLAYRVACSIVVVSLEVSKSTGRPSLPLLYQQRLTNIKILTAGGVGAGVVFVLKSYMFNFT